MSKEEFKAELETMGFKAEIENNVVMVTTDRDIIRELELLARIANYTGSYGWKRESNE